MVFDGVGVRGVDAGMIVGGIGGDVGGGQVWNMPRRDLQRPRDGGQPELRVRGVRGDRVMRRGGWEGEKERSLFHRSPTTVLFIYWIYNGDPRFWDKSLGIEVDTCLQ